MQLKKLHILLDRTPREIFHMLRQAGGNRNTTDPLPLEQSRCVFVLSTGRAGTQTLAHLAALAPGALAFHEPLPKLFELSKLAYHRFAPESNRDLFATAFLTARTDLVGAAARSRKMYIETSPHVTFLAPVIQHALARAKFIHLIRNPASVVASGMRRKWFSGNVLDRSRITPKPGSPAGRRWSAWSVFEKNIWLWKETNCWIDHFLKALPPESKLVLRAEGLFAGDGKAISSLYEFLETPRPPRWRINRVLAKRLNSQSAAAVPGFQCWSDDMRAMFHSVIGDTANRFGYNDADGKNPLILRP